mmetsp:Transcript_6167/g.15361  ORF Transcript_6167/g.15361 Transcript_6167/m.15361 type:complete len:127 (+) Transcript_6167:50-430(+)
MLLHPPIEIEPHSETTTSMSARTNATALGTNLILSSLLAALSYLPFELIAKSTLVFCLAVFVSDPYPGSRILALFAVGGVLAINRIRMRFVSEEEEEEEEDCCDDDDACGDGRQGQRQMQDSKKSQ